MDFIELLISRYNYWAYIILMMVGVYAIVVKKNLIKKIVGMNIVQTAIILFYISVGDRKGATLPIFFHGHDSTAVHGPTLYANPLPHVLMLTAIVVSVATFGVALALAIKIYHQYGTLEEDEIHTLIVKNQMPDTRASQKTASPELNPKHETTHWKMAN